VGSCARSAGGFIFRREFRWRCFGASPGQARGYRGGGLYRRSLRDLRRIVIGETRCSLRASLSALPQNIRPCARKGVAGRGASRGSCRPRGPFPPGRLGAGAWAIPASPGYRKITGFGHRSLGGSGSRAQVNNPGGRNGDSWSYKLGIIGAGKIGEALLSGPSPGALQARGNHPVGENRIA
jgi:hypothetical protein